MGKKELNKSNTTATQTSENPAVLRAKYLETKAYLEKHVKDDLVRSNIEHLLSSDSPIVEFKKIGSNNYVRCTLESGVSYAVPVDHTLQLFYDKMERFPDVVVDFGQEMKNRVEILPYQNKISYIDGRTGKEIKSMPIDTNLIYVKTDSKTGNNIHFDSRLNPAILSILSENLTAQNDYINATGNIDIIYNFEEKSNKLSENLSNKNLSKEMNKYYKSEKDYVKELQLERQLSSKIGYAGIIDKIQSNFEKNDSINLETPEIDSFKKAKKEFRDNLKYVSNTTISHKNTSSRNNNFKTKHSPEVVK